MASQQEGTERKTVYTDDVVAEDVAVGEQESIAASTQLHAWTWRTFFRSVLLQMILFGL